MPALENPNTPDRAAHITAWLFSIMQACVYSVFIIGGIMALCEHFVSADLSEKLVPLSLICMLGLAAVWAKPLKRDLIKSIEYGSIKVEDSGLYGIIARFTHRRA